MEVIWNYLTTLPGWSNTNTCIKAFTNEANPALTITKTPNPLIYSASGQTITYTYTVKNTGNVELNAVNVVDSTLGQITLLSTDLAPNAQTTGTATYQIKQADLNAGSVSNTATVYNGTQQLNQTTTEVLAIQSPALTITKTPNPLTYSASGQTITYTYTVKNIGNVELNAVKVADSILGQITLLSTDLAPNAQTTGTATHQTTVADMNAGSVSNTATVYNGTLQLNHTQATITATQPSPNPALTITATQPSPNPALTITKTPNPLTYSASGQTITYTYTVKNTGNAEIKGPITVTDDKFGTITIPNSDTLSPGSSVTGTATYKITQANINAGHVTNAAFATGSFNSQPIISPNAIAIVRYEQPTKKEEHNEEEHNGDRDNYGGPSGYGGAVIPMIPGPMYGSPMYGSEPYGYGGEPYGPTETLNSESNVHKAKAHLSKHKHKNHSKHHTTKHHKAEKN